VLFPRGRVNSRPRSALIQAEAMNTSFNLSDVLGLGVQPQNLNFFQISLRGIIVFIAALVMLRLGDKRFLSKRSAFDVVLGFILASMLARAVNGSSAFFPTIGGGFVVVLLHRLLAFLTRDAHWFGLLIKGRSDLVIEDGRINRAAMKANNLSEHDLIEDLRMNGNMGEIEKVKAAYCERNGQISVVKD
jgi:uncharacterized membrane protein YcaP (DUF421 family)